MELRDCKEARERVQPGRSVLHVWCSSCGQDTRIDTVSGLAAAAMLLKSAGWIVNESGRQLCPACVRG